MSTYIQGVTDYIPQIQPFKPDLNFLGNIMQAKQTKYDAAKKQVNDLYGSLLYGPMSREDNIAKRDEYFKTIDNDIKRISGLDLSLQQNVDQALNVFKGLTDDKYLISDMIKTKNYQKQVEIGENLKNCFDPTKCKGEYWEPAMKKLQYKMEEFKKVSADEALNFELGSFDPYYNWEKDAMKLVTELKYDVSKDDVTKQWVVHNTNGELVEGGLYGLFTSVYGEDPRVTANYDTKAYVHRKESVENDIMQYGSEEASEQNYLSKMMNSGLKALKEDLKNQTDAYDQLNNRQIQLEKKAKTVGGLTKEEQAYYNLTLQQKEIIQKSRDYTQSELNEVENNINTNDIKTMLWKTDKATAAAFKKRDMDAFAKNMSLRGAKSTVDINPIYKMDREQALAKDLALFNFGLDTKKLDHLYGLKMNLEKLKKGLETGDLGIEEGVAVEADPENIVRYDLEETPNIIYQKNRENQAQSLNDATSLSADFLYKMFNAAKNEATTANNGADQYLKKTYGNDWRTKITDKESLLSTIKSKKLSPLSVFNTTLKTLDQSKNPTSDVAWAQSYINNSKKDVHYVKQYSDAALSKIKFNTDNNKKIVAAIQKNKTEQNMVAGDADLLLDNGFLMDYDDVPAKFVQNYLKRHPNLDESDAEDAYEELKTQFFTVYNNVKDVNLNQGVGLKGSGFSQASPLYYASLDSKNKKGAAGDVVYTINNIMGQQGYYSAKIGGSSKSNYSDKSDEKAEIFLKTFVRDAINANGKDGDRPIFSAKLNPQAAQNEKLSSITLTFSPDYIKKLKGSKESPGPLAGLDISNGVTLFYNNEIPTRFSEATKMSNFETNLRVNKKAAISEYNDIAGSLVGTYDDYTGLVTFRPTVKAYNPYTGDLEEDEMDEFTVPINDVKATEDSWLSTFENIQAKNLRDAQQLAKLNKK